jgi:DNA-binding HxlR family transcriptional regulator
MQHRKSPRECPLDSFLRLLSGPWTLYIIWILLKNGPTRFGVLKRQMHGISTRDYKPTIPPQVTYGMTERGKSLSVILKQFNDLAKYWYERQKEVVLHSNDSSA